MLVGPNQFEIVTPAVDVGGYTSIVLANFDLNLRFGNCCLKFHYECGRARTIPSPEETRPDIFHLLGGPAISLEFNFLVAR